MYLGSPLRAKTLERTEATVSREDYQLGVSAHLVVPLVDLLPPQAVHSAAQPRWKPCMGAALRKP